MIIDSLDVDVASFEARTGWTFKPEGACKAAMCVPISGISGGRVDARVLSERLGIPALVLPQAPGATPEARDLFSTFDALIDRLLGAAK